MGTISLAPVSVARNPPVPHSIRCPHRPHPQAEDNAMAGTGPNDTKGTASRWPPPLALRGTPVGKETQ